MSSHSNDREDEKDTAKGAFKLDLIETVNADPMMQPSDLAVIVAHLSFLEWPDRSGWLSTSMARAKTGLSERQIILSRRRLADRGYMIEVGRKGVTKVFRFENPRSQDMRDHVEILTGVLRESQKDRQTERRRLARVVSAKNAETEMALSHSPGECDVSAKNAGNSPELNPSGIALKEGQPSSFVGELPLRVSAGPQEDAHTPYPVPTSQDELAATLSGLFDGCSLSPVLLAGLRRMLAAGRLTPAIVDEQRRNAS